LRNFGDIDATRKAIYDNVYDAALNLKPVSNLKHTLSLRDVQWMDGDTFSKKDRKEASLRGDTLGRRLRGTWVLTDNNSGKEMDRRPMTLFKVPHLTEGGTFVNKGNEYALVHQSRLLSGPFTRTKENGEIETHTNVLAGGPSHRYWLDPEKGRFFIKMGNANIPLMPLLKTMGASDKEIRDAWGPELHQTNSVVGKDEQALHKLKDKVLGGKVEGSLDDAIRKAFEGMTLDPEVTKHTLDHPHQNLNKDAMLSITRRLLAVSRGESPPDDRDHLAYQRFLGPEDLFRERLAKDRAGVQRQLLYKAGFKGDLQSMPTRPLQGQLDSALLDSGLGRSLEEINPAEILDKNTQVSRMGEGGIPSYDAIPDEARSVQPSHYGFIDPLRTPESFKAGVDTYLAGNARKGSDGKLYGSFTDVNTGKTVYKTPQEIADTTVTFPGAMGLPYKRIPAMQGGRLTWVKKRDVTLTLPQFEHAFSPLDHFIPLKSMLKGQRASMASRMSTQALPVIGAESPLVQNAVPGSNGNRSYEDEYGKHMGAMFADKGGRVLDVTPEGIKVKHDDGTTATLELYNNHPYNRKTFIHQTPTVKPGDRFSQGQLMAHSNFTDKKGASALGLNARVAYLPWGGQNFEDATVISESMAKRMTSEHMYQHGLEISDQHKIGKSNYISLFPGRYDRKTLDNMDDRGVIKVGTTVKHGDPLIIAAEQREHSANKIHKKRQAPFADASITWDHHDEGVVTDVVDGKDGPVVVVKSKHPTQVGDKMCFDTETRVLTKNRGFVSVADVTVDDWVATLNASEQLEWQRPTHVWAYEHKGEMYKLVTKHLDMLVTMDHRLWVSRPGEPYSAVTAREFYASKGEWQFKKDCAWVGQDQPFYAFPVVDVKHRSDRVVLDRVAMDDWLEFLGYYIAEGWCVGNYVKIAQFRESPHFTAIRDVIDRLGLPFYYNEGDQRFELGNAWLAAQLAPLGDSYTERVPEYVQELPPRQLGVFFDAYLAGDGHKGDCWEYSTSSERLAYDMQLICLKLGWCASVKEVTRTDNWAKERHWRARINRRHLRPWWKKGKANTYESVEETVVAYDGMVYCVTVPNHTLYVERRDKTYWSQNSGRYG